MRHLGTRHVALATLVLVTAACGDNATPDAAVPEDTGALTDTGAPDAPDVPDVPSAIDVRDVPTTIDTPDVPTAIDVPDVPPAIDVPDVPPAIDVPDVQVAVDGPDVPPAIDVAPDTGCGSTETDPRNCGRCGNDCTALAGVQADRVTCAAGACVLTGACAAGQGDCDGMAANGCEAPLNTAARCGACATACVEPAPMCTAGADGGAACASGCSGATPVRCAGACVSITTDPLHCGGCGTACPVPANGVATCAAGTCGVTCNTGFHLCAGACVSNAATATCGASCTPCAAGANSTATCDGTTCGLTCGTGFGNCDGMAANGCETDLNATATSCGACTTTCPAVTNGTPSCAAGACGVTCNTGFHLCGGACVSNSAVATCGASCTPCATAANATATCNGTVCGFACGTGFGDCDGMAANGCEANLTNTVAHCGGCGAACPVPVNGTATCVASTCGVTCNAGYFGPTCEDTNPCSGAASAGARLAWEIALPLAADWDTPANVVYAVDNRASLGGTAWTRVAFCLRLNDAYAYAEMDDFTGRDLARIGPPMDWSYIQAVTALTVRSNVAGVANVTGAATGRVELFSNCYTQGLNGVFDYDDSFTAGSPDCYGSFQVHNATSTVLAWNAWSYGANNDEAGIGNQAGGSGNPDWTFAYNNASYATRVLRAYIVP